MLIVMLLLATMICVMIAPLIGYILDTIVTFVFVLIHGCMAFVIKNIFNLYKINEQSMFNDSSDLVCNIIATYLPVFRTIAISVIILIAAWNLFKTFFQYAGFSSEVEEPWKIGIKLMIFATLVLESREICRFIVKIFEAFYNELGIKAFDFSWLGMWGDAFMSDAATKNFDLGEGIVKYFEGLLGGASIVCKCLMFIILLVIDCKLCGVGLDLVEKYLRVGFLVIISPLAFACGIAKSTSQVLSSWIKVISGTLVSVLVKYLLIKIMLEKGIAVIKISPGEVLDIANLIKSITVVMALSSLIEQADALTRELGFQIGASSGKASDTLSRITGRVLK